MSFLHNKRMMKEKKLLQTAIEKGEIISAEWSDDGKKLKTTHFAGDLFGDIDAEFVFPPAYPLEPPILTVTSSVLHPNIYSHRHRSSDMRGRVCMTILDIQAETGNHKSDHWTPAFDVTNLLKALTVVLNNPGVESPANVDANKLYLRKRDVYNKENMALKKMRDFRKVRAAQDKEFEEALLKDKEVEEVKKTQQVQIIAQTNVSGGMVGTLVESEQAEKVATEGVDSDGQIGDKIWSKQRIRTADGQEIFEFIGNNTATVKGLKVALERKRLDQYASSIMQAGCPLADVVGFGDCSCIPVARPVRSQRAWYCGHHGHHCFKTLVIVYPNGLMVAFGPFNGARHDSNAATQISLDELMIRHCSFEGRDFLLYLDAGFGIGQATITPFRRGRRSTPEQAAWNREMSRSRIVVEWGLGRVKEQWKFLTNKANLKTLLQPVAIYFFNSVLFTNLLAIFNGSQVQSKFEVQTPTLEEYLALPSQN